VNFLLYNITNPRYSSLSITTTHKVLDIYSAVIGQSDVIDELLLKLQAKLEREIQYQKELVQLTGALDVVSPSSSPPSSCSCLLSSPLVWFSLTLALSSPQILTAATDKPEPFNK
jgi:hypothetical protein